MPGVLQVLTGADLVAAGVKPMPGVAGFKRADGSPGATPPRRALAHERVRFVGEAVAAVVAETLQQARDAAEAIDVDYEELPMVVDLDGGDRRRRAGAVRRGAGQHRRRDAPWRCRGHRGRLRQGRRTSWRSTSSTSAWPRSRIEPRTMLAELRRGQRPPDDSHEQPDALGRARRALRRVSGSPKEQVRVIVGDVGGGFGMKTGLYPGRRRRRLRRARAAARRSNGWPTAARNSSRPRTAATSRAMPSWRSTPTARSSRCACARSPMSAPTRPAPASPSSC